MHQGELVNTCVDDTDNIMVILYVKVPHFHGTVWKHFEKCSQMWTHALDILHDRFLWGWLLSYHLLLCQGTSEEVLVYTGLPGDALQYEDTASVLTPHTTYQYRIVVRNSVGLSYGPWAEVTTRSSSKWTLTNILLCPLISFQVTSYQ